MRHGRLQGAIAPFPSLRSSELPNVPPFYRLKLPRAVATPYNVRSFSQQCPLLAKRKSTVRLQDLPQGKLGLGEFSVGEETENEAPAYPTVVQQARNNMRKFENCVVLTRVGGFYELYFEHAEELGPMLGLKVASKKTMAGPVAMVELSADSDQHWTDKSLGRVPILPTRPFLESFGARPEQVRGHQRGIRQQRSRKGPIRRLDVRPPGHPSRDARDAGGREVHGPFREQLPSLDPPRAKLRQPFSFL